MEAALPSTVAGWAGLILATLTILVVVLRVVIGLAKQHIKAQINTALAFTIRKAVMDGVAPINARLDAMQLQLVTQDGELARIRDIETKINNGLGERQERIEEKVDQLIEHHLWDGTDRRTSE